MRFPVLLPQSSPFKTQGRKSLIPVMTAQLMPQEFIKKRILPKRGRGTQWAQKELGGGRRPDKYSIHGKKNIHVLPPSSEGLQSNERQSLLQRFYSPSDQDEIAGRGKAGAGYLGVPALHRATPLSLQVQGVSTPINKLGTLMMPLISVGCCPSCFQWRGYLASPSKSGSWGEGRASGRDGRCVPRARATDLGGRTLPPSLASHREEVSQAPALLAPSPEGNTPNQSGNKWWEKAECCWLQREACDWSCLKPPQQRCLLHLLQGDAPHGDGDPLLPLEACSLTSAFPRTESGGAMSDGRGGSPGGDRPGVPAHQPRAGSGWCAGPWREQGLPWESFLPITHTNSAEREKRSLSFLHGGSRNVINSDSKRCFSSSAQTSGT